MTTLTPVWATRPRAQNTSWCSALSKVDFLPIDAPILAIAPVQDVESCQTVKNQISDLDRYDMLIFVSQNAVMFGWEWIDNYWPQLPTEQTLLAIGKITARILAQCSGRSIIQAPGAMNTEALLALPECQAVEGKRILVLRGKGGLPRLGQVLSERGAQVTYCELYHRERAEISRTQIEQLKVHMHGAPLLVPVFSGESVQLLSTLLCEQSGFNYPQCEDANVQLVVPGARVADLAQSCGFKATITAENASQEAMLSALLATHYL